MLGCTCGKVLPQIGGRIPVRAMLNWTDLCGLMMLLVGPASGFAAAHQHQAGIAPLVLFTIIGLIVGICLGQVSGKLAYSVLDSENWPDALRFCVYMFIPTAFLFAVPLVPALLAMMIYR